MLKKEKVLLISSLALILSSGHAFCMPTEGVVVNGAVTNVDNPAEVMKAEANSIVNWWSFDINKNEKVVFDTQNYTVLNKVLNGQESKILGSLSDIGNGRLILFNPSGVVIGDGATINVNDLTLTTLEMPSENLESFASNGSTFNQTSVGQRFINIGKNATFDINKALQIYAGGIYIADGVKIIPNNKNEELSRVVLGTGIQVTDDHHFNIHNKTNPNDNDAGFFGSGYRDNRYEAVNGPNITINGTLIGTPETPVTNVKMIANQIDINSSEIYAGNKTKYSLNNDEDDLLIVSRRNTINDTNLWNHSGNLYVISGNHLNTVRKYNFWNEGTNWYFYGLNHSFPLIIKNSTLVTNTEDIKLYAPQFDIQNTAISSNRDLYMYAVYDSYYYQTSNTWKAYTVYKTDWTCLVKLDDETRNKSELRGNANLMGSYVREDSGRSYTEDFANYKDILFKKNNTGAPTVDIPKRVPEEKPAEGIGQIPAENINPDTMSSQGAIYLIKEYLPINELLDVSSALQRGYIQTQQEEEAINKANRILENVHIRPFTLESRILTKEVLLDICSKEFSEDEMAKIQLICDKQKLDTEEERLLYKKMELILNRAGYLTINSNVQEEASEMYKREEFWDDFLTTLGHVAENYGVPGANIITRGTELKTAFQEYTSLPADASKKTKQEIYVNLFKKLVVFTEDFTGLFTGDDASSSSMLEPYADLSDPQMREVWEDSAEYRNRERDFFDKVDKYNSERMNIHEDAVRSVLETYIGGMLTFVGYQECAKDLTAYDYSNIGLDVAKAGLKSGIEVDKYINKLSGLPSDVVVGEALMELACDFIDGAQKVIKSTKVAAADGRITAGERRDIIIDGVTTTMYEFANRATKGFLDKLVTAQREVTAFLMGIATGQDIVVDKSVSNAQVAADGLKIIHEALFGKPKGADVELGGDKYYIEPDEYTSLAFQMMRIK